MSNVSAKQTKLARELFVNRYTKAKETEVPITGCALSVIKLAKTCQEHPNGIMPSKEELDDNCLMVTLGKTPPNWSYFPLVVENVRLFYRVVPEEVTQ